MLTKLKVDKRHLLDSEDNDCILNPIRQGLNDLIKMARKQAVLFLNQEPLEFGINRIVGSKVRLHPLNTIIQCVADIENAY